MRISTAIAGALVTTVAAAGCSSTEPQDAAASAPESALVLYVGRSESLVAPLISKFTEQTGIQTQVRYSGTPELAAQLLEEGSASPAEVFWSQDAGALEAVSDEGLLTKLPKDLLDKVPARFRAQDGTWVGTSGRARVLVYNKDLVPASEVPESVYELTDPKWSGQVGIAPMNASFQSFITAMRKVDGEARTKQWLEDMVANDVQKFESNTPILDAVNAGQIKVGLVNHYYWYERAAELGAENMKAVNYFLKPNDVGSLVNVAGVGVLEGDANAVKFARFLLSKDAQEYISQTVAEYPLVDGIAQREGLPPLSKIQGPDLDLAQLSDVAGTQRLLQEVGLL